ncbi:MAG TPA: glycoside hydrolase family 15 protein [Streptosporangiaceae bacterium]
MTKTTTIETAHPATGQGASRAGAAPHVLRGYAFVADGERGALVGPEGDYAWMCFPSWESPSVFGGLVGGTGHYIVEPAERWRVWGGYYEERSLIWRGRWTFGESVVECREALARPASTDRVVVLRRIRAVRGPARMRARLDLHAGYGVHPMTGLHLDGGIWSARSGPVHARWAGAAGATATGDGLVLMLDLREGQSHDLVLELADHRCDLPLSPGELWTATEADWHARVPDCADTLAPRDAQLAYAVMAGLTSARGGMAAAATASLPERLGEDRDYDYRYAWVRDQCYAGQAVAAHGAQPDLLDNAVRFVAERLLADGDRLRPASTVAGGPIPPERPGPLPGYPGSAFVTGNRVRDQFQLDSFGEALLLFATAARADRLPDDAARAARTAVDVVARHWERPDAGIWETQPRRWTHSRLICVAGLRAAAACLAAPAETRRWLALAESIITETTRTALDPAGYWRRAPDDGRVDAALIIPPVRGALPADDPRTVATVETVRDRLARDGFVYRYRVDDRPLGDAEGAFMLCGFFLALAEHHQGDPARAIRRFERVRSGCGTTGLFSEEYDTRQRQLRANLPQAFVHALFLESATRFTRPPPRSS